MIPPPLDFVIRFCRDRVAEALMAKALAITRTEYDAAGLRHQAGRAREPAAARRMLALAAALEGQDRTSAARLAGMDRQTLRDWVHRYNEQGLAGLYDRREHHRPRRLTAEQEAEVAALVQAGPDVATDGVVRWRLVDLCGVIAARFGVSYHLATVSRLLRRLGLRRLAPRPHHPKRDLDAQTAFKKTSRRWQRRSSPPAPPASRSKSGSRTRPASASKAR
jgi:transposase